MKQLIPEDQQSRLGGEHGEMHPGLLGGVRCAASQLRTFQRHVIIRSGVLFIFIRHKVLAKYSSNNNLSSIQKLYLAPAYDYISAIICCSSP